ncbi:GPW/gp25 family protein [Paenibacillus sp. TRM 82003]|nr:GPW/gp25 family protein [Paenibacillus sp. TRM 82003]
MSKSFLGKGWKFPIQVDEATGRVKMVEHEDDIAEAIRIIIWTAKGERIMRPRFGSGIEQYMFKGTDDMTLSLLGSDIREAILTWELRVANVEVNVTRDASRAEQVNVHVSYEVRATNHVFNQVYPFYLHEGAN